jgi:hypothetical protein
MTMFCACSGWISVKRPVVYDAADQILDVIAARGLDGNQRIERRIFALNRIFGGTIGGSSALFCGMYDSSSRSIDKADFSSGQRRCATPDFEVCVCGRPGPLWSLPRASPPLRRRGR